MFFASLWSNALLSSFVVLVLVVVVFFKTTTTKRKKKKTHVSFFSFVLIIKKKIKKKYRLKIVNFLFYFLFRFVCFLISLVKRQQMLPFSPSSFFVFFLPPPLPQNHSYNSASVCHDKFIVIQNLNQDKFIVTSVRHDKFIVIQMLNHDKFIVTSQKIFLWHPKFLDLKSKNLGFFPNLYPPSGSLFF